ncbi:MAG TPA: hypothetical protein VF112_06775, partial [Candidatus Dormibacteraeota bacterium]
MSGSMRALALAVAVLAAGAGAVAGATRVGSATTGCGISAGALQATTSRYLVALDAPGRRLDVRLCSKDGGQAVQGTAPTITVTDTTANGAPHTLPIDTVLP